MIDRDRKPGAWRTRVRAALAVGGLSAAVVAFGPVLPPAAPAADAPKPQGPAPAPAADAESEYVSRPVAFIGRDTVVTREELGEFLVMRRGAQKVDLLVNRRIIDQAAREAGVEVTAAEVDASLAEDLKGLGNITQGEFVKQVLRRYGKNLIEWKEDVIRPKLMLAKLCRERVHVGEDDLKDAFEARYGEKVECRIIQWPLKAEAEAVYPKVRDDEQEFNDHAKRQKVSALAASGGKIKPVNHHLASVNPVFKDKDANDRFERAAFGLQPGEVSELLDLPGGWMVVKCDRRLPGDTTVNPAAVRAQLLKEVAEQKTLEEIPKVMKELRDKAKPKNVFAQDANGAIAPFTPGASRGRVVAYVFGDVPVTRQELGEYLITRYGPEALELLVNRRIIDEACKSKDVTVDSAEIEVALEEKIAAAGVSRGEFINKLLPSNHTTLAQYKEDVLRPQLLLTKLSAGRVKVTDEDLHKAYEAYYGEKIECRLILWPREERKYAMAEYASLRDSETAFADKAQRQASATLAENHGHLMDGKKVRLIGRYTLGNQELERELFSLHPGEVSKLVETPEGIVVVKCDRRVPPDKSVSLDSVRAKLEKEVRERLVQADIPLVFADLRKHAEPRLLLKDPNRPEDLTAAVERDLKGTAPPAKNAKPPAGN